MFYTKFNTDSFSTFGVARNDFFLRRYLNSPTDFCNNMFIILVLDFSPLVTRTSGGFRLNISAFRRKAGVKKMQAVLDRQKRGSWFQAFQESTSETGHNMVYRMLCYVNKVLEEIAWVTEELSRKTTA